MKSLELKAEIARSGYTAKSLAAVIGMPTQTLSNKIAGKTEFKGSEITAIARMLNLNISQVNQIFFDGKVN